MKRFSKTAIVLLTTLFVVTSSSIAHADNIYDAAALTAIAVGPGADIYIRFDGLLDPGPCGENNHWVMIPSTASDVMRSLVLSLYFSGKSTQIRTSGCNGSYEVVYQIYSPKGG